MIPRETRCKWCGARILFVTDLDTGRRVPVDSAFTPFQKRPGSTTAPMLWTIEGATIPCEPLPEERSNEADGFAHRGHICPAWAKPKKKKPLTRAEKFKEIWEG